ncbi:MAG: hypothetical protein JKY55_14950 [Aliivibrio sp.]|uniref:hypothetical protein n=1 Tax=Aliivibrio sp. TaxID=1872443 RepID=UPI001A5CFC2F|nr:hypothetical protein [Aliivibrio sp.]
MRRFTLTKITALVLSTLPIFAMAKNTEHLEAISSESTSISSETHKQTDSSRIYLEQGAIWASRDITRFDPVLNVTVSEELEVENDQLSDPLRFTVNTNFSYYITKWEIEVYQAKDRHLSQPLTVISGNKLNNDSDIEWDGQNDIDFKFSKGKQLLFRLKAWDKDGNIDITTLGVVDLVAAGKEVSIRKNDNDTDGHGRSYGRSSLMRHNIPTSSGLAKFMGTGLDGVDKVIIGEDEFDVVDGKLYAEQFLPTDAYMFPTTVVFESGEEKRYQLYVRIPNTYYSQTGLADLYIGKNRVTGNNSALTVNDQYHEDIYNQGRLAYFSQGKFGDKLRIVTHVDTKDSNFKDMFKHPFAADDTTVFDILEDDDEMYYGDYGDGSNITKVVNTKGKVYLDLQYDKSNYLWGNFNTGVTGTDTTDYNRSLYGFKADYRTRSTTKYGEDRLNIVGFASEADTLYSHDEFLGTGGSLYFLKHGEVVPGSDKVSIRVMNKNSGIEEKNIPLQPGRDYEIDEFQGRIILTKPLTDIVNDSFGTVIDDSPRGGFESYLVTDYEYVPVSSEALQAMSYGLRAKGWLNDYVGVGSTYIHEEKENQNYQMVGGDLTLRATEGTFVTAEVGHSEGTQADSNFVSFDGGLTFDEINSGIEDREGNSVQVTGVANLYDLFPELFGAVGNDVKAWYKNKESGYSYASQSDDLEQESVGVQARIQVGDSAQVATRYTTIEERNTSGKLETDSQQLEVETEVMLTDNIKVAVAGKQVSELNNQDEKGDGTLAGARVEYIFDSDNKVYLKGQTTVETSDNYDDNNSVAVGAETRIISDLTVSGEYTTGDRGDATEASIGYDISSDYTTYVTYVDDQYEDQNSVVFGQKVTLTETVDFYQENQFVKENNGKGQIDSFGFDVDVSDDFDFGISYQQGEIEYQDQADNVERTAVSFNTSLEKDNYNLKNKFEYRIDVGTEKIDQYVTTNRYTHHLTDEYTLFAKFNYSKTVNQTKQQVIERFIESNVGIAYRPIYNDRLNLLARYTYLVDLDALNRDVDYSDEESHIFETEGIYSWNAHIDLGAKLAYKQKDEVFNRESGAVVNVNNDIYLTGLSASYYVMKDWDLTGEYHWKVDRAYDQLEHGALLSVNKHLTDNFKIGIGYNFSAFEDDLVHEDDYNARGVFVNLVGKI